MNSNPPGKAEARFPLRFRWLQAHLQAAPRCSGVGSKWEPRFCFLPIWIAGEDSDLACFVHLLCWISIAVAAMWTQWRKNTMVKHASYLPGSDCDSKREERSHWSGREANRAIRKKNYLVLYKNILWNEYSVPGYLQYT